MHLLPLLFTFLAFAQDNPGADDVFKALELPATNIQEDLKEVLSDQKPKTFRFKFQEVSKVCSVLKSNVHLSKPRYSKTIMRHKKFHVDVYGQMSNVEKFAKYKPQIIEKIDEISARLQKIKKGQTQKTINYINARMDALEKAKQSFQQVPVRDLKRDTEIYLLNLDEAKEASSVDLTELSEIVGNERLAKALENLKKLGSKTPLVKDIVRALDLSMDIVGKKVTSFENPGVIEFIAHQLNDDPILYMQSLDFYSDVFMREVAFYDKELVNPLWGKRKMHYDTFKLALSKTNNDPIQALRVIGVYGHDDVWQGFGAMLQNPKNREKFFLNGALHDALDYFVPMPESTLYANNGLRYFPKNSSKADVLSVSNQTKQEFKKLYLEERNIMKKETSESVDDLYHNLNERYRAGYYHMNGGAFYANELIRNGLGQSMGVRLPVFYGELMGYYYKKILTESRYLQNDALILFETGCKTVKSVCVKPEAWTEIQFKKAELELKANLLHIDLSAEQHRESAEWVFRLLENYEAGLL